jgi:hypothetical protein
MTSSRSTFSAAFTNKLSRSSLESALVSPPWFTRLFLATLGFRGVVLVVVGGSGGCGGGDDSVVLGGEVGSCLTLRLFVVVVEEVESMILNIDVRI